MSGSTARASSVSLNALAALAPTGTVSFWSSAGVFKSLILRPAFFALRSWVLNLEDSSLCSLDSTLFGGASLDDWTEGDFSSRSITAPQLGQVPSDLGMTRILQCGQVGIFMCFA